MIDKIRCQTTQKTVSTPLKIGNQFSPTLQKMITENKALLTLIDKLDLVEI